MYLETGLGASVFDQGYGANGAAVPAAAIASPQASGLTVGQKAFGITAGGGSGPRTAAYGTISAGVISLGILIFMWWSLPR
jgi:hypothetical protein